MVKVSSDFHVGDIVIGNEKAAGYTITCTGVKCEVHAIDHADNMINVSVIIPDGVGGPYLHDAHWVHPCAFDIIASATNTPATKKAKQYDTGFEAGVKYGLMLQDSPWVSVKDKLPDSSTKCLLTVSAIIPGIPDPILEVYPHIVNRMDGYWVTNLGIHIDDDCVIAWMKVPEPYNPENT